MGFLKWLAFCLGMVLGLAIIAVAGTVVFTYLFTGRLASVEVSEGKPAVTLMTPDEVVAMVREQVKKAKTAQEMGKQRGKNNGAA
jgi:hypothetical protein